MTPHRLLETAIKPALAELAATGIPDSFSARRFLLAIAMQESNLTHRRQVTSDGTANGPAASYWQGEVTGGMILTLKHRATAKRMRDLCEAFDVDSTPRALWEAIRYHDILAAGAARLLIYTLPSKLPTDTWQGWAQYNDAWRPGKPHPSKWPGNWDLATKIAEE